MVTTKNEIKETVTPSDSYKAETHKTTGALQLQLITPDKILFSGEAAMVTAPGAEGEFGVLPGHMPLVATLIPGTVAIDGPDGSRQEIAIQGGVAEILPDHCTLLVEPVSA